MTESPAERIAAVRRLLDAARRIYEDRRTIAPELVESTGLSPPGVDLGFEYLEREVAERDLELLIEAAHPAPNVHVILSANVFVAPLRAIAFARAASPRVAVRPSPRDTTLTRALIEAAEDGCVALVTGRDVSTIPDGEIHVYGRDETVAAVKRQARPGVAVRAYGAGMGLAIVTQAADLHAAAERLAADVVPFDQRGCLSPRVALVEGDARRAETFGAALDECLADLGRRVPRGGLDEQEQAEAVRWRDATAFAGCSWWGRDHGVAVGPEGSAFAIPPPGRHLQVLPITTLDDAAGQIAPIARFVVAVGTDDAKRVERFAPAGARVSPLGTMQRPPFDGPVDKRSR